VTRVLIADDQEVWRNLLKVELERNSHYQVCGQAVDGAQLVAMALEIRPDVVIVDLVMPNVNGLDAAREISRRLPGIPIVMYTLTDGMVVMPEASKAGIHSVVQKQEGIAPLLAAIESALEKRSANPMADLPLEVLPKAMGDEATATMHCESGNGSGTDTSKAS
jgi:DNA-binding NarL/FixJ family response regulator